MMSEEGADTLRIYWEHFFKAETGTYEKSTWLDLFLAEFIIRLNDGANPKDTIKFCPVSGVVSLVGCELLCGIHRVTSSINTHYSLPLPCADAAIAPPTQTELKADDARIQPSSLFTRANAQSSTEILRKYLLGGVAWRCLVLLRSLGVEGLSCCRQLSSVLIWLYGELCSGGVLVQNDEPAPLLRANQPPRSPIHQLFSNKIWSKPKVSGVQGSKVTSTPMLEKGKLRQISKKESDSKLKRKCAKHTSEHSSESGDSNGDLQILNRSMTVKVCTPNDDFDYFDSPLRSSNDYPSETLYSDPYFTPRKIKPKADDYMNDKHRAIINSEITTYEFVLLIIDLLQELCKAESSLSGSEGSQISVQCINFSLGNICSVQFSSLPLQNGTREVSRLKVALTELLIVSLNKVLIHPDLCARLINNGLLPMLLRVLEDVIRKTSTKYNSKIEDQTRAKETDVPNTVESENLLKFTFGIAYSITAFFHCLLMQCRSVDKLREFTDQFRLYGECLKGGLLKDCIELMIRIPCVDEEQTVILIKKLIESIGKLISGMKRVRSEVIHSAACPKSRHKVCRQRVIAGMHHHHDILGEAGAGLMSSVCCISVLYGTLTSLVTDEEVSAQTVLRNKILRVMLNCGVCCCFSTSYLMECIVRLMLTHDGVAAVCLQVLEHTIYGELGASVLVPKVTDQLPCLICEPNEDRKDARKHCQHGVGQMERKSVWSFLIHYNSLLQLDNHNNILHATVTHLLRVTPKCRMEMKYELLFSVIYPTFIVAKHRYIIRLEESAYFLTVSCLNIFASLLNTVSFAEQFIQKGGLSYVLELVSLPEFSTQCCSIMEIAIIVEILKLIKENSELTYSREMNSLASVQMLFKSLSDMTDKCFNIYKLKLSEQKFEELCDISQEREMLGMSSPAAQSWGTKTTAPQTIKTTFACVDNSTEDSVEDHIDVLKNVCTFWSSCAGLCLYSPMFRQYVVSESVFVDSYALLKVLLHYVCNCECCPQEMRVIIKVIEALLIIQFSAAEVNSGRSKLASCNVVRAALVSSGIELGPGSTPGISPGPEAGLRALCDTLMRVAAARPSSCHAMPRHPQLKVPPLTLSGAGREAEGSSSGESGESEADAAVFATDHSDLARPDDGYEADVEIGQLEYAGFKSRKVSASSSIMTSTNEGETATLEQVPAECGEYSKSGDLAHPELCLIVVDILTQIITKVLSLDDEADDASETGRLRRQLCGAGARVSRACCGRLALAAPVAAPLLRRLLAPPAAALLHRTDDRLLELQRAVLELVVTVGSRRLEPGEAAALLRVFAGSKPPLALLLPALLRLLPPAGHTPHHILTFPVRHAAESEGVEQQGAGETPRRPPLTSSAGAEWRRAAMSVSVERAGWAPWLQGFALLLWLRADPRVATQEPDEWQQQSSENVSTGRVGGERESLMHVCSVGHESLMFELWLAHDTGTMVFRLRRGETRVAASEARVSGVLPSHRWACLALNVRELLHLRRMHIQVTLFVDGWEYDTVLLPLQGILMRKVTPSTVLLGECVSGARPGVGAGLEAGVGAALYHVSHLSLYRTPAFTAPLAMHLAAHGPDHCCQVRCESPNYALLLTPKLVDSNIDWDQVYEISSSTLRELHDNQLLTFSAQSPQLANLYHQTVALPTVWGGTTVGGGTTSGGGGAGTVGVPEALACRWVGRWARSEHCALPPALRLLGGPELLLYLFARVVELSGSAEQQAMALAMLLRACSLDARLLGALHADRTLDLLLTVFAAPVCRFSHHMLKVILDKACSVPVLTCAGGSVGGGGSVFVVRNDAYVLEPRLFVLLTRAWKSLDSTQEVVWEAETSEGRERRASSVWALFLCCVCTLLRPDHPRYAFNHYQLTRVQMLPRLLLACKERFLDSEREVSGTEGLAGEEQADLEGVVKSVRGLLGAPPRLDQLAPLVDFLLLMHQASDTFVTHSRANFYFLLTSETQEMSEFSSNLLSKRKNSKREKRKSQEWERRRSYTPSTVSSEDVADNSVGKETVTAQDLEGDHESSGDSTKQLKGIINMQIKEGRKQNFSSTSENSDANIEASGGVEQEALSGYVVVDEDDINHTTVDMYSSGIYHQSRVRAGAAPEWAACEGLLLLLRDALSTLPEHELQGLGGVVRGETLAVLGNARAAGVRAALVRVLAALQRRASPERARVLSNMHLYLHLANQISLYPGSWELAAACAALVTKCDVPLEDQLDEEIWVDVGEECVQLSPPLLALLPCCLHDVPLAHNLTLLLRRLIDKTSLKMLSEVAMPEVVVRSIRALALQPAPFEGRELLLEDLHDLLSRIAIKALDLQQNTQIISDMQHMLTFLELCAEEEATGSAAATGAVAAGAAAVSEAAQQAQATLLTAQLDFLEEKLHHSHTATSKYSGYFSSVLSVPGGGWEAAWWRCVSRGAGWLAARDVQRSASPALLTLATRLLRALLPNSHGGGVGTGSLRPRWWTGGTEWAATLQQVCWWALSPAPASRALQPALLRALYLAPPPLLQLLTPHHDPPALRKLAVYLVSMLQYIHAQKERGEPSVELPITDWARSWAVATQAELSERVQSETLAEEAERLLAADEERRIRAAAAPRARSALARVVFGKESVASKLTESAMALTRRAVELQNGQRKAFMEHLRRAHCRAGARAAHWQRIVDDYTHEQAVWHDASSYPQSWQLDPTEGPGRVRVRMARAHLHIQPRFLKPQYRHRAAETSGCSSPLRSVIGVGRSGCGARGGRGALVAHLHHSETVAHMARVTYVTVASDTPGELLLSDRAIHFVPEENKESTTQQKSSAQSWALETLVQVATRRWCLQERAVELFLSSGHAHLLAFQDLAERDAFLKALNSCHLPNRTEPESLSEVMNQWRNGTITNWEYLMRLNGLAGRTYNDLMQYPVLPFVLADYSSRILDLNDPASFRDLSRPMAIQNRNREQHYINTYNDLKMARREGCSPLLSRQPHHYASLYSNSGGVLHYLVRVPPFTELFLNYQDNNFDMPDRTFHSLATTWRLITNDSPTDVKELIPELFYLPELFHNNEGLELGVRQCGLGVDDVELPAWAADARLFTLVHRQALEAPLVSDALPYWIDLVFGYKQLGQAAVDAINVFPACTYYGFDPGALEDELERTAAEAMVRTYGQAPRQLLRAPHPQLVPDVARLYAAQRSVWAGVEGARWGRYCGSPALGNCTLVARRSSAARHLVALPHARSAALLDAPHSRLIPLHVDNPSGGNRQLGIISWGHSDSLVRLKRRRDQPPQLLMCSASDQITHVVSVCASASAPFTTFVGHRSGRVVALRVRDAGPAMAPRARTRQLHAHAAPLADVHVCARAALLLTASVDGLIVLWDLNKLTYIRTVPNRDMIRVTHVTISETLSDVASVHDATARHADGDVSAAPRHESVDDDADLDAGADSYENDNNDKYKSLIRVHTVNGRFVGSVKVEERVTAVCYSNAAEGVSVNCVAAGLSTGGVRLYSSWDLSRVAYIPHADCPLPLVCLTYSSDSTVLFACYEDGTVAAWESGVVRAPVRLLSAASLL